MATWDSAEWIEYIRIQHIPNCHSRRLVLSTVEVSAIGQVAAVEHQQIVLRRYVCAFSVYQQNTLNISNYNMLWLLNFQTRKLITRSRSRLWNRRTSNWTTICWTFSISLEINTIRGRTLSPHSMGSCWNGITPATLIRIIGSKWPSIHYRQCVGTDY